jgi:hypothetical protein
MAPKKSGSIRFLEKNSLKLSVSGSIQLVQVANAVPDYYLDETSCVLIRV